MSDAKFTKHESAFEVTKAVLWGTVPITVIPARKRKVKSVARVKSSKGFVKGTSGIATGYPRKTFV
jgi:hypothetical protein